MRIREMTWMGLQVWPPQWSNSSQAINHQAVLMDVKVIVGTDLFRIDVAHNGIPHLGIMYVGKKVRESLFLKMKENIGKKLAEIADLEIEIDREGPDPLPKRPNRLGSSG